MTSVGGINAYSWDSQNYTEQWDSASDRLIGQMYWSMSGTVLTCTVVAPDGSEATTSLDYSSISSQGTTTFANGAQITVDTNGGTFTATAADGSVSIGSYDSTGAQTLSVRRISGPPVSIHVPTIGKGALTGVQRANLRCLGIALVASAVLAALIAAAVAAVIAICTASAVVLCAAAGLLAAGVVAEAIALYKAIVASACA